MKKYNKTVYPNAFFESKTVPIEDATISIMTNALQYGTGIFAGIRGYYNNKDGSVSIFRISDHYKRFLQSTKILNVSLEYTKEQLENITIALIKKNKPTGNFYIRPFAYASSLGLSPNLNKDRKFDVSIYMIPLENYLSVDKGLKVCVSTWRRVSDNAIPARGKLSGAYMNSALARAEAEYNGYDEAIFLTEDGHVCEGSAENIWIVRDGVLITPSKTNEALEGITKQTIISIARDIGVHVQERTIDRSELYLADEAFFSGTGVQIAWIKEIDNRTIGTNNKGLITNKLQKAYFDVVKGNNPKYDHWCTKLSIKQ